MTIPRILLLTSPLILIIGSGCETATGRGALIGSGVGAGTGALLGSATGNAGKGAVIGTAIGAGVGALVGNEKDREDRQAKDAELQQTRAQLRDAEARPAQAPLGITDVQQLAASGAGDEVIINQIRTTGSTFQLSPADIQWLKTNNVSDRVIVEMQNAAPRGPRVVQGPSRTTIIREGPPVIYEPYPYRPRPVYVYDPYYRPMPPPRPAVGFGVVVR